MARRTIRDIEKIWANVEGVRKLSDRAIGIGPFGVGMDAVLTWIPVVGTVYTVGAGGWLMMQALRANASPATMLRMLGYLGLDTATSVVGEGVPVLPDVVDVFFQGHAYAARALQKDIESTHWVEASRRDGGHDSHVADMRAAGKRRVVYLHD